MDTWRGFTSEDIQKLQSGGPEKSHDKTSHSPTDVRAATLEAARPKRNNFTTSQKVHSLEKSLWTVPADAKLSSSKDVDVCMTEGSKGIHAENNAQDVSPTASNGTNGNIPPSSAPGDVKASAVTIVVNEDRSYELIPVVDNGVSEGPIEGGGDSPGPRQEHRAFMIDRSDSKGQEKTNLDLFRERQKMMEEQNKRKKQLLTKIIEDKKKQTHYETQKVLQVQDELSKLDALLSTDVGILRDQIETASHEFNEAQKRYDKAESEFIDAKMHLFMKLERKELLTEHLCKIIEVNEQRKAKKLSELLAKLEITESQNEEPLLNNENDLIFSGAVGLNEISYTTCTTLKDPNKNMARNGSCGSGSSNGPFNQNTSSSVPNGLSCGTKNVASTINSECPTKIDQSIIERRGLSIEGNSGSSSIESGFGSSSIESGSRPSSNESDFDHSSAKSGSVTQPTVASNGLVSTRSEQSTRDEESTGNKESTRTGESTKNGSVPVAAPKTGSRALAQTEALQQINLVTALSINNRNESVPSFQNLG